MNNNVKNVVFCENIFYIVCNRFDEDLIECTISIVIPFNANSE